MLVERNKMVDENIRLHHEWTLGKPKSEASFAASDGSAATWWVYYFDEGKKLYITAIPLNLKRAQDMARAAQKYFRGRAVIQITETPPNAAG